jgi:hypothetical protein
MRRHFLRLLLVLAIFGLSATSALAEPVHERTTTEPETITFPAGELCDFDYQITQWFVEDTVSFYDESGTLVRLIEYVESHVTHTNLDTGFSLSEVDHFAFEFEPSKGLVEQGVFWHLRTEDGKLVLVQAGRAVFDSEFNLVKVTPNFNPDFAAVICPALGGAPA